MVVVLRFRLEVTVMRIVNVEEYSAHLRFGPHTKMDIFLKEFFCDLLWIKYIYSHIVEFERFSI